MKKKEHEIKARDFEEKKEQLKKFSKSLPETVEINSVAGGRHLWRTKKKVTGDDMNEITGQLRKALMEQNNNTITIFKEFKSIYNTFDALDKDYIQRILVNLEATKKANEKAVLGLEKNKELVDSQQKIIEVLKKHKDELDKLKYLKNIDLFYENFKRYESSQKEKNESIQESTQKAFQNIEKNTEQLKSQEKNINELKSFKKELEELKYLKKIDEFYNSYETYASDQKYKLESITSKQQTIQENIQELKKVDFNHSATLEKMQQNYEEMANKQEQLLKKNDTLKKISIAGFSIVFILLIILFSGILS